MLLQQKNDQIDTSYRGSLHALLDTVKAGQAELPVLTLQVGSQMDPGIRHKYRPNEDMVFVMQGVIPAASPATQSEPFVLLLVADGMGGQGHGRMASRLAVQSLVEYVSDALCLQQRSPESLLSLLTAGVQYANRVIHERNLRQHTVMGTTITAALVIGTTACVAHVGDSRLYLYREPTGLAQITRDHSVVAALVAAGIIEPEDIYSHPWRNQIYRSLGGEASVEVDAFLVPLTANDVLLLCSDGLWEMVHDQQIATILATPMIAPTDTAHALIEAALAHGGEDNVSAIVAQVSKDQNGKQANLYQPMMHA